MSPHTSAPLRSRVIDQTFADSLEVLLLLVWRHLDYYARSSPLMPKSSGTMTASLGRSDASSLGKRRTLGEDEIAILLEHVKRRLMPVLERLDSVHLVSLNSFKGSYVT